MFDVYGLQGRVFSGTLEQLRVQAVARVPRSPRVDAHAAGPTSPDAAPAAARQAVQAYAGVGTAQTRQPLTRVADVMHSPAITVAASATLGDAWQQLARHGVGQAPVVDAGGMLVGLIGRAELLPPAWPDHPGVDAAAWRERRALPVTATMWTPVPSTSPGTDLRRVAGLLLHTGLPGLPVTEGGGQVVGFVSRTDLMRALAHDPPLDVWG